MARLYQILRSIFSRHRRVILYAGGLMLVGILACLRYIKDLSVNTGILFIVLGVVYYLVESADRRNKKQEILDPVKQKGISE